MQSQLKKPFVGEGRQGSHEQGNRRRLFLCAVPLGGTGPNGRKIEFWSFQIEFLGFQIEFFQFSDRVFAFSDQLSLFPIEFPPFEIEFCLLHIALYTKKFDYEVIKGIWEAMRHKTKALNCEC